MPQLFEEGLHREFHYYDDNDAPAPVNGFSIYNIRTRLRDQFKEVLLNSWPWLKAICPPEDVPDEMIDTIIEWKVKADDSIIVDRQLLSDVCDIINNYSVGFKAHVDEGNDSFIIDEDFSVGVDDKSKLKQEIESFVKEVALLEELSGKKIVTRHVTNKLHEYGKVY